MSAFLDALPKLTPLALDPTPELVRRVRELVVTEGYEVALVSRLTGLSRTQVHNIVTGRCYKEAGGPMRPVMPRIRGERRACIRCRSHYDDALFVIFRDSRTGICQKCVKPEDLEAQNEAWAKQKRRVELRKQLHSDIKSLCDLPWESVLDEQDRAELDRRLNEIKRARAVCSAPWSAPRMGRGR